MLETDQSLFALPPALIASLVAASVAALGVATVARFNTATQHYLSPLSALASAIVVTAALVHVYPESLELSHEAPVFVLIGYALLLIIHLLTHRDDTGDPSHLVILAPMIGISFHSFVDGMIYGAAFSIDVFTGITAVSGLILHEFAEGIVLFLLVRAAGFSTKAAVITALLGAALTTPIGTLFSLFIIRDLDQETLGLLLAMAGGALLHVGTTNFIGHLSKASPLVIVPIYLVGMTLALLVFSAHEH